MCYVRSDSARWRTPPNAGTQRLQPARDPDDIRYWPRREGGNGFPRTATAPSRQYSALRTYRNRTLVSDDTPTVSIVTAQPVTRDYTPDTIRSRARAVLALAMTRAQAIIEDEANELRLNELAPTMAALGRISGVAVEEQKPGDIRIHIVRDAPPLPEHATPHALREVAPAKDMGTHDLAAATSPIALPSSVAASPHAVREVGDVTADDATVYDDDA